MVDHEMIARERRRAGMDSKALDAEASLPIGTTARIEDSGDATDVEIAAIALALGVQPHDILRKECTDG
ncbi:MAG: hypothetical protein WCN81_00030 [Actinomycetes bacterium]